MIYPATTEDGDTARCDLDLYGDGSDTAICNGCGDALPPEDLKDGLCLECEHVEAILDAGFPMELVS